MTLRPAVILLLGALAASPAFAQDASGVDNTRINKRDRQAEHTTPMDQPNDKADIDVANAARKAIVADDSLSTMAQNVKLIAANGVVTLRGPVKDGDEKSRVENLVKGVPGVTSVQNQLDIKH